MRWCSPPWVRSSRPDARQRDRVVVRGRSACRSRCSAVSGAVNGHATFGTSAWQWGEWRPHVELGPGVGRSWSRSCWCSSPTGGSRRSVAVGGVAGRHRHRARHAGGDVATSPPGGRSAIRARRPPHPDRSRATLVIAGSLCVLAAIVGSIVALIVRFRRSSRRRATADEVVRLRGIATVDPHPRADRPGRRVSHPADHRPRQHPDPPGRYRGRDLEVPAVRDRRRDQQDRGLTRPSPRSSPRCTWRSSWGWEPSSAAVTAPTCPLSIAATAVVAVAFQPVRERVQRFANRLVYGDRATPYEVLSRVLRSAGGHLRHGRSVAADGAHPRRGDGS